MGVVTNTRSLTGTYRVPLEIIKAEWCFKTKTHARNKTLYFATYLHNRFAVTRDHAALPKHKRADIPSFEQNPVGLISLNVSQLLPPDYSVHVYTLVAMTPYSEVASTSSRRETKIDTTTSHTSAFESPRTACPQTDASSTAVHVDSITIILEPCVDGGGVRSPLISRVVLNGINRPRPR